MSSRPHGLQLPYPPPTPDRSPVPMFDLQGLLHFTRRVRLSPGTMSGLLYSSWASTPLPRWSIRQSWRYLKLAAKAFPDSKLAKKNAMCTWTLWSTCTGKRGVSVCFRTTVGSWSAGRKATHISRVLHRKMIFAGNTPESCLYCYVPGASKCQVNVKLNTGTSAAGELR